MVHVLRELVGQRLCEHPAIEARPEWEALAQQAFLTLHELYQAIGREHP